VEDGTPRDGHISRIRPDLHEGHTATGMGVDVNEQVERWSSYCAAGDAIRHFGPNGARGPIFTPRHGDRVQLQQVLEELS